ncbi:unnamed protein product, partial [Timema podura]|nr:unnamed protein product [Timema podura]
GNQAPEGGRPLEDTDRRKARENPRVRCTLAIDSHTLRLTLSLITECERINKAQFNTNLIKMFKTEYNRKSPPPSTEDMQVDLERAVLNWKFSSLDLNGDDYLSSVEYKDLSRMVRKAVKPKKCSKVFTKTLRQRRGPADLARRVGFLSGT